MSQLGMGVMLARLSGNEEAVKLWSKVKDQQISEVTFDGGDALHFKMGNGVSFKLGDEGQSCCEHRYMKCDDDLAHFKGAKLLDIELREVANDSYDHETCFVQVKTSEGDIVANTHNEHNGYYGGFAIMIREEG